MLVILFLLFVIVASLIWASRRNLEDALPIFAFFVVLMPLESKLVVPGLCDFNTMRVSLLTLLVLYFIRGGARDYRAVPLKALMLIHVAWALLSTVYSISVVTSVKQIISQVLEYYLLYFLFVRTITRIRTIYKILFAVSVAVGLCCVFSLLEAYANWSIVSIFPSNLWTTFYGRSDPLFVEWGRGLRVRSTFPHPILFGDALAMCIPLTMYLLSIWEGKRERILLWISLVLMFWAIYKTSSRGPWLALCICSVLLGVLVNNAVRKYLTVIAIAGLVVFMLRPGIWETVTGLYTSTTDPNNPAGASYLYRDTLTQTIQAAVGKDQTRTLLGYGLGTFRELGLDINFMGVTKRWYTCDNNWDLFLYETGYVGLAVIACLLFRPLWIAFRNYRLLPRPDNYLCGVLLICLLGFDFLLMSVAGYSWGQQGYLAWILIAVIISYSRLAWEPNFEEEEEPDLEAEDAAELDLSRMRQWPKRPIELHHERGESGRRKRLEPTHD